MSDIKIQSKLFLVYLYKDVVVRPLRHCHYLSKFGKLVGERKDKLFRLRMTEIRVFMSAFQLDTDLHVISFLKKSVIPQKFSVPFRG